MADLCRRGFFGSILRTVAVATALIYAPGTLARKAIRPDSVQVRYQREIDCRFSFAEEWKALRKTKSGRHMRVSKDRYVETSMARRELPSSPWPDPFPHRSRNVIVTTQWPYNFGVPV